VKRATRRRVNVKCGTVPFSLGGCQSSPVTEVERERGGGWGQAEIRIRTEVFGDCLILIALLSRIERGSS
jgi:hypothetical protein